MFVLDHVRAFVLPMRTRLPFRYGIATMTMAPHVLVELTLRDGRARVQGYASEHLPPRWFVKDADLALADEVRLLARSVLHAVGASAGLTSTSAFGLWRQLDDLQSDWASARGIGGLVAGLGTSLVERALIDATCRSTGLAFVDALERGVLGLDAAVLHPELSHRSAPPVGRADRIAVRHTVGLGDPLTDDEVSDDPDDGLPVSLEASVRRLGLRWFKLKTVGDADADVERIRRVEEVCTRYCATPRYTLDGNESMRDGNALLSWLERLRSAPALAGVFPRIVAVEQPLHRSVAMQDDVRGALRRAGALVPVIIDESDEDVSAVRRALDLGYAGGTYKGCKGVFRGLANAALVAARGEGRPTVLTAEDLSTVPPLTVGQDLVVCAAMGLRHVERNGHHYFGRLAPLGPGLEERALAAHPDVYAHDGGQVRLVVREGEVALGSLLRAPFGYGGTVDVTGLAELTPESAVALL